MMKMLVAILIGILSTPVMADLSCPIKKQDRLRASTIRLDLVDQDYKIIHLNEHNNCYAVFGLDENKHKVILVIDPYNGKVLLKERVQDPLRKEALIAKPIPPSSHLKKRTKYLI